jgi:hypothetical protein
LPGIFTAVRKREPLWEIGHPIPPGVLDDIPRESVERGGRPIDMKI